MSVPLVHKTGILYQKIYAFSQKIPKRARYGIYAKLETLCLDVFELSISAMLEETHKKTPLLKNIRLKVELMKRFIRTAHEIRIIPQKKYIELQIDLQELSKMTNGWIAHLSK